MRREELGHIAIEIEMLGRRIKTVASEILRACGFQDAECSFGVVAERRLGIVDRLLHVNRCRKMKHDVPRSAREHIRDAGGVFDIAADCA